ncbi:MAG TPA: preprotein translocase subunit SecY [Candidatus Limnocylindrales bacterium]|nr:preprotein translocase subunit SecY [Candidatus Limnocylindrales bacterium]
MLDALINSLRAPDIRRRILWVLLLLFIYRFFAHIPVPGVNQTALEGVLNSNDFLQLLNLFSGGGLSNFSIVALGVNPYINASIIMQLMTGVVPRLQALSREGEYGRNKINQYTRYLSVPMGLIQAYGYLALLSSPQTTNGTPVISQFDIASLLTITQLVTLTAGTVLAMWVGELITERGIGNGVSFLIFAGIVSRVPTGIFAFLSSPDFALGAVYVVIGVVSVAAIVYIQEGQRRIPVQYASRVRGRRMYQGGSTFLPLRVNQAGVIPIIFAISIILFPVQLASYFSNSAVTLIQDLATGVIGFLDQNGLPYLVLYFLLTVGFTYFYTAFTFKPDETADQLRKNGGFIPGIRPGNPTREYLAKVVVRISLAGALFLGLVAVLPILIQHAFSSSVVGSLGLGGTALLIVVSVVVETMKQLEAQLMMRNYEGFIR